jgi:hypothetical protein
MEGKKTKRLPVWKEEAEEEAPCLERDSRLLKIRHYSTLNDD